MLNWYAISPPRYPNLPSTVVDIDTAQQRPRPQQPAFLITGGYTGETAIPGVPSPLAGQRLPALDWLVRRTVPCLQTIHPVGAVGVWTVPPHDYLLSGTEFRLSGAGTRDGEGKCFTAAFLLQPEAMVFHVRTPSQRGGV